MHRLTLNVGDAKAAIPDYFERVSFNNDIVALKAQISADYNDIMAARRKSRIMTDLGFESAKAKEDIALRDFFEGIPASDTKASRRGWIEKLEKDYGMDTETAYDFILHNVLQPTVLPGRYKPYTAGKEQLDLPFYSMNKRMSRVMLRYYTENGLQPIVDRFVKNWEGLVDGDSIDLQKYVESSQYMYGDKYNYNKLDDGWSYVQSLIGPGFRSPFVEINLEKQGLEYVRTSVQNTGSGKGKYILRNKKYSSGRKCK